MSGRESVNTDGGQEYQSKKVSINGQTVTLYSSNGQTWFSSPEEIPEVMARLDNTRILLNDPKGEAAPLPPKATSAKYRIRGPKPRPILQQDGRAITGTPVDPISASSVEVKMGDTALEVVNNARKGEGHSAGASRKGESRAERKKLVAPVSTGPKPVKVAATKAAPADSKVAAKVKAESATPKKVAAAKATKEAKPSTTPEKAASVVGKSGAKKATPTKDVPKSVAPKSVTPKKGSVAKKPASKKASASKKKG